MNDPPTALVGLRAVGSSACRPGMNEPPTALVGLRTVGSSACRPGMNEPPTALVDCPEHLSIESSAACEAILGTTRLLRYTPETPHLGDCGHAATLIWLLVGNHIVSNLDYESITDETLRINSPSVLADPRRARDSRASSAIER